MAKVSAFSGQSGWKTYNLLRKKAMERSGTASLLLSLSIAFLVVFLAAQILSWLYYASDSVKSELQTRQESLFLLDRG